MDDEESAAAAARLEAALERIAQLARPPATPAPAGPDTAALAKGLDGLIAQLRGALEQ